MYFIIVYYDTMYCTIRYLEILYYTILYYTSLYYIYYFDYIILWYSSLHYFSRFRRWMNTWVYQEVGAPSFPWIKSTPPQVKNSEFTPEGPWCLDMLTFLLNPFKRLILFRVYKVKLLWVVPWFLFKVLSRFRLPVRHSQFLNFPRIFMFKRSEFRAPPISPTKTSIKIVVLRLLFGIIVFVSHS